MKSSLFRLIMASLFVILMATVVYAADGSNYVNVTSCREVEKGIMITRESEGEKESFLPNGIRDAGHGLRDYLLKCVANDRYYVEWKDVSSSSSSASTTTSASPSFSSTSTSTQDKPLPDFIIKDILQAPNQAVANYGDVLTIQVKNVGFGDAPQDNVSVYIWIDNQLEWTYNSSTLHRKDFLKAGGMSNIQPQVLRGKHEVKACVDPNDFFAEANETNNCLEVTLTSAETSISGSAKPATSPLSFVPTSGTLPDIVVNIDKIDSTSIVYAAEPWTWITYTVTNKGGAATNSPVYLRAISNGSSENQGYMMIDPLDPGASKTNSFAVGHDSLWPAGSYKVKLEADYNNAIAESNENNNVSNEIAFKVTGSNVTPSPSSSEMSCGDSAGGDGLYMACIGDSITHRPTGIVAKVMNYSDEVVQVSLSGSTAITAWFYKNQSHTIYDSFNNKSADFIYTGKTPKQGASIQIATNKSTPPFASACKMGLESFAVEEECGKGYRYARYECQDGYSGKLGGPTSCKPEDLWYTYVNDECKGRSSCSLQTTSSFDRSLFSVTINSSPLATNGSAHENGYLASKVGQKIKFHAQIEPRDARQESSGWRWDEYGLDCTPYESDRSDLSCKVIAETPGSQVYFAMYPGNEKVAVESNRIKVYTETQTTSFPAPSYTTPSTSFPQYTYNPVSTLDTGVSEAGYEDEVVTATGVKNPFTDTDLNTLVGQAAAKLHALGIIGGYPDGTFKGHRPVNRAEAAKFLLLSRYSNSALEEVRNEGKFWDVLDGQWYTRFILNAHLKGIMSGYSDGSMGPGKNVNTAEFLKMLSLNFALPLNLSYSYKDVPKDAWFAAYAGIAQEYNLFPDRKNELLPAKELTRAEVAVALYQYLSKR